MPTIYRNSSQYSGFGNGEYVSLTQAEYDALSEAEKDNGNIYFITDGVDSTTAIIGTGELDTEAQTIIGAVNEINERVAPIGTILHAAWTATSSSANGTNLTNEITLTPGIYIINISIPTASQTLAYMLSNLSSENDKYWSAVSMGTITAIFEIESTTTTRVRSAASTSVTFSVIERGHLEAIRIL